MVHGPGGIGKSAVLARHIVWALDEAGARVALLDFDDVTLNPLYPGDLARRIIDLVSRQADGDEKQPLDRLRMVTGDIAYYSDFRTESSGRTSSGDSLDWAPAIADLARTSGFPILVVFDTVEHVQRRGPSAVFAFRSLIEALLRYPGQIRVVLSGRTEIPELAIVPGLQLTGLDPAEACQLLISMSGGPVTPDTAAAIVRLLGTSPLTIRLAARLLAGQGQPGELFGRPCPRS